MTRRHLWVGLWLALAAMTAVPGAAAAKHPDFAGVWHHTGGDLAIRPRVNPNLYVAKYRAIYDQNSKAVASGKLDLGSQCMPPGAVRDGELGLFEVINGPAGRLTVLYEFMSQIRRIYLDGKHPTQVDPSVNGHSVAHWEGNTLVVDTVGISEFVFLGREAAPHSDRLRMIERISLTKPDLMAIDYTVEDPEALVRPWTFSQQYERVPNGELLDYECNENPRNPINADGSVGFQFQKSN